MSTETTHFYEAIDAWEKKYKPIKNHLDSNASWNGTMFETFGKEVEFVFNQPSRNVWTWIDGEEGDGTFLISGLHHVNRIGYFVCEVPCGDFVEIQIESFSSDDDE